eukprot:78290_1
MQLKVEYVQNYEIMHIMKQIMILIVIKKWNNPSNGNKIFGQISVLDNINEDMVNTEQMSPTCWDIAQKCIVSVGNVQLDLNSDSVYSGILNVPLLLINILGIHLVYLNIGITLRMRGSNDISVIKLIYDQTS